MSMATCSSASRGERSQKVSGSTWRTGFLSGPWYSHAATWQKLLSSRSASPSSVWNSSRKWPPQDSRRSSASRTHQLGELEEIRQAPGVFRGRVQLGAFSHDLHVLPKLLAERRDLGERFGQAPLVSGHAALVPHDLSELAVERRRRTVAFDTQERGVSARDVGFRAPHLGVIGGDRFEPVRREIVPDGVRNDEVTVGQTLHERRRAEPVRAVIRKVGLADDVQARKRRHEIVVDPEPAHRVVHAGKMRIGTL
jgi:hypothetical protein